MREQEHRPKASAVSGRREHRWPLLLSCGLFLGFPALCAISSLALALLLGLICANIYLVSGFVQVEAPARQATPAAARMGVAEPRATLASLATEVAALSETAAASPVETPDPLSFSIPASIAPIRISHPMAAYTIEGLSARPYPGGAIRVRSVLTATDVFTRYYIDYPSDGLTITGIVQVPPGRGPFPVIILNHGYISPDRYWSGADTWNAAEYLNRRGYLTVAPDFRNWGESDPGNSFFSTGPVIDDLNLISSLSSLSEADPERVGMWGHSMGGGVTTKVLAIDGRIKAAVLYAPVSADEADSLARWGTGCKGGEAQSDEMAGGCAGAEMLTSGIDQGLYLAYQGAASSPQFLYWLSPIHYLDRVSAPVQIHSGTADTRTPPEWAAAIYAGLQGAGKEVEYFTYPGQGHTFQGEQWQLFMERVADFFDVHVKGR
jgi:pimeloyl-ACP methyl ester carboxylesterase